MTQIDAVDELHHEKVKAIDLAEFEDRDDIGMIQMGQRPGLAGESLGEGRIAADLGGQNLDRHDAIQPALPGLVNGPHPAFAEQLEKIEQRKASRKLLGRRRHEIAEMRRARRLGRPRRGGFWIDPRLTSEPRFEHALRAQAGRRASGNFRTAGRTGGRGHGGDRIRDRGVRLGGPNRSNCF